ELVSTLAARHADDAEDLREALQVFQRQKLSTLDRLAKLNDSQWARLGLPLGIEALLREEVDASSSALAFAQDGGSSSSSFGAAVATKVEARHAASSPAPTRLPSHRSSALEQEEEDEEDDEGSLVPAYGEQAGLRRRGGSSRDKRQPPQYHLSGSTELRPPADLEKLWQQLLEDTLPPDKREALQDTWDGARTASDKYMIYLEYSSYLRKQDVTEEEKAERRKQMEPLMQQYGLEGMDLDEPENQTCMIWLLMLTIILFSAGAIYYAYRPQSAEHDPTSL
ncbi:unnamed protein product, partial [Polarella glacialis]